MRNSKYAMGFDWVNNDMKIRFRRSNNMALKVWEFKLAKELEGVGFRYLSYYFGGRREKWDAYLKNYLEVRGLVLLIRDCPGYDGLLGY